MSVSKKTVTAIANYVIGIIVVLGICAYLSGAKTTTLKWVLYQFGLIGLMGILGLAAFLHNTVRTYTAHRKHDNYPGPVRESFYAGNYYTMRRAQDQNKLFDLLLDWTVRHGSTIIFWRFEAPKWFTTDPNVIRSMLTEITSFKKARTIPNRTLFNQRITGTSSFLTVQDGKIWAQKRKVMSAYFTKIHMSSMFDQSKDFIRRGLEKQLSECTSPDQPVDIVEFYGELFQFFLGALGFDLDCELVSGNAKFHNLCIQRILKWVPLQLQTFFETLKMKRNPEVQETVELVKTLRQISMRILDYKREELKSIKKKDGKETFKDDIVHFVIKANRFKGVSKSDTLEYEMDDMMTIFLVIDNMAKTLASFFVEVIRHPDIYEKVAKEAREADLTTLKSMDTSLPYTELVILECLRLHPTLMRGIRLAKKGTKLNDLELKENALIFFGQLVLHKHPKYWDRPNEFLPERFANGTAGIEPFTYLPFVAGPRVCMGKHLAMLSMKLAIVETLKNFDMKPVPGTEKEKDWDLRFTIVKPIKGHMVNFHPVKA